MITRFDMEHELDHLPTLVGIIGSDEPLVVLDKHIPWQVRIKLAKLIMAELEKENPILLTDKELDEMSSLIDE